MPPDETFRSGHQDVHEFAEAWGVGDADISFAIACSAKLKTIWEKKRSQW